MLGARSTVPAAQLRGLHGAPGAMRGGQQGGLLCPGPVLGQVQAGDVPSTSAGCEERAGHPNCCLALPKTDWGTRGCPDRGAFPSCCPHARLSLRPSGSSPPFASSGCGSGCFGPQGRGSSAGRSQKQRMPRCPSSRCSPFHPSAATCRSWDPGSPCPGAVSSRGTGRCPAPCPAARPLLPGSGFSWLSASPRSPAPRSWQPAAGWLQGAASCPDRLWGLLLTAVPPAGESLLL